MATVCSTMAVTGRDGTARLVGLDRAVYHVAVDERGRQPFRGEIDLRGGSSGEPYLVDLAPAQRMTIEIANWRQGTKERAFLVLTGAGVPYPYHEETGPDGTLLLDAPPPGRYSGRISVAGWTTWIEEFEVPGEGPVTISLRMPEGSEVSGWVLLPDGSLRERRVPTPGGYLIPKVPMRRTRWLVQVYGSYTSHSSIEKAVSEVEQRMNDGDFVYARDVGTAWEIDTLVVHDPKATRPVDFNSLYPDDPGRLNRCKWAGFTGAPGRNQGKFKLNVTGIHHEARILLHESAHVYGNYWHQLDVGDGLCGGGAYWADNNVALLLEAMKGLAARTARYYVEGAGTRGMPQ